jgi:hypothetical protein
MEGDVDRTTAMACGCAAVACGRAARASASFHSAPSDLFHPTTRVEQEELDGVTVVVRLIGDTEGREISMANQRREVRIAGSLVRPTFGLIFLNLQKA